MNGDENDRKLTKMGDSCISIFGITKKGITRSQF